MKILDAIRSWFTPNRQVGKDGRVKCTRCRNRVLRDIAADNGGLCGVCFRRNNPKPERSASEPSPYHKQLQTPVDELDDDERRLQLSVAITCGNETRIDELFAVSTEFISKPAKYSSNTWLGEAVSRNCSISILDKLLSAGCDPNSYLRSPNESRPLEIAIHDDRIDTVKWLLDNGADPNIGRPVISAINYEKPPETQLEFLKLLIDSGAEINRTFALYGDEDQRFTVLDWATLYGNSASVIEYLKSKGAVHEWKPDKIRQLQEELGYRRIVT